MNTNYLALDIEIFPNLFQVGMKSIKPNSPQISIEIKNAEPFTTAKFNQLNKILSNHCIITYNGMNFDNLMLEYLYSHKEVNTYEMYEFSKFTIQGISKHPEYKETLSKLSWELEDLQATRIAFYNAIKDLYSSFSELQIGNLLNQYKSTKGKSLRAYNLKKAFKLSSYPYESIDLTKTQPNAITPSLKMFGGLMNMNIQELPYPFDSVLDMEQINNIIAYNENDLDITIELYNRLKKDITLRENLNIKYNINTNNPYHDYRNKGNANLGLAILQTKINVPKSKVTSSYTFKLDLPKYLDDFETPILKNIVEKLKNHTFTLDYKLNTILPDWLKTDIELWGVIFSLGGGGIHSNEKNIAVFPDLDKGEILRNIDVTSYYPWIIFIHSLAPSHFNDEEKLAFVNALIEVFKERAISKKIDKTLSKRLKKGERLTDKELEDLSDHSLINGTNKLILNAGGFGKLGDKTSPLFDPKMLYTITIIGQLSLLLLAEQIQKVEGVTLLSANTDGIELIDRLGKLDELENIVLEWELKTYLNMEFGKYFALASQSVNSYVAIYDGYCKFKGQYETNPSLGKSNNYPIVYKAIEQYLLHKTPIEDVINNCKDITQFTLVKKVTGGCKKDNSKYEFLYDKQGRQKFSIIPKKKRIFVEGIDVKDYIKQYPDKLDEYYFDIYDESKPRLGALISENTIKNVDVGSTVRYYFTNSSNNYDLKYVKSDNSVPNAQSVCLLQNINHYDSVNFPIDYNKYIKICKKHLNECGIHY